MAMRQSAQTGKCLQLHKCEKEIAMLQCVPPHRLPVLYYAIVEPGGHIARVSERTKLELVWSKNNPAHSPGQV